MFASRKSLNSIFLNSDLGLGVGTRPPEGAVAPEVAHLPVERVREDHGQGHALLGLVGGVAEHQTLETVEGHDYLRYFLLLFQSENDRVSNPQEKDDIYGLKK